MLYQTNFDLSVRVKATSPRVSSSRRHIKYEYLLQKLRLLWILDLPTSNITDAGENRSVYISYVCDVECIADGNLTAV